jgi:hypothetical protein
MNQRKEFWIIFGINFFFPGGGHLYAGDTNKGVVLLILYLIGLGLTPVLYIPGFVALGAWIYALVNSKEVLDAFDANKEAQAEAESKLISPEQFISSINRANQLLSSEMISEVEFVARKQSIISDLQFKKLNGDKDDLLLGLAPLKKNNTISADELKEIKKILTNMS